MDTDNELCQLCQYIYEIQKLKYKFLRNTLVRYQNIEIYCYLDEVISIDKDFFKRISTRESIKQWKQSLLKIWNIKLEQTLKQVKL